MNEQESPETPDQQKKDRRVFETTTYSEEEAKASALKYFRITDESLLEFTILNKGSKRFIFFGRQEITYRFTVKAIFKKLLLPFLIQIVKLAKLSLFVEVSYREPNVKITFSGKDEKLLTRDNHDLLYAFDHIIRLYLYQKVALPKGTRISVNLVNNDERNTIEVDLTEDQLNKLISTITTKLDGGQKEFTTDTLSPSSRRFIHHAFQDHPMYETQSIGQGRVKRLIIKRKK